MGGSSENFNYYLYEKIGLDGSFPLIIMPAKLGFLWKYRIVYADSNGPINVLDDEGRFIVELADDIEYLYRVTYSPDSPHLFLISGQKKDGSIFSIAHNFSTDKCFELLDDGTPAYKAAVFDGKVFYATKKADEAFEDRNIVEGKNVKWIPVPNNTYIKDIKYIEEDKIGEDYEL